MIIAPMYLRTDTALRPPSRPAVAVARHPGIIVHCTGGQRPATRREAASRWRICQDFHTGPSRRWSDIGYHFGVTPDGAVLEGRGFNVRGAHAKGYNRWLGVVVLGKGTDITEAEQAAIEAIYSEHLLLGGGSVVLPHNAVSRKSCPGPAVTRWIAERFGEGGKAA